MRAAVVGWVMSTLIYVCFRMSVDSSSPGGNAVVRDTSNNTAGEAEKLIMYSIDTVLNVVDYYVRRCKILKCEGDVQQLKPEAFIKS